MRRMTLCGLGLVYVLMLAGCAGMQTREKASALDEAVKSYGTLMRWGNFDEAVKYLLKRNGEHQIVALDRLKSIRVASYDVTDQAMSADGSEAKVVAQIGFYHEESGVLHSFQDDQKWWYESTTKRWLIDSDFPDFFAHLKSQH